MKYNLHVDGVSVEAVFDKLGGVEGAKRFLAGNVEVVIKDHIVNGNADPFLPDQSWKVEEHQKSGDLKLTRVGDDLFLEGNKITFHLSPNQMGHKSIKGDKLRKELEGKRVLNAGVLDYLREHPELIPESWKVDEKDETHLIFFWGTIYSDSGSGLCVRYLRWDGDRWYSSARWLGMVWSDFDPAAVLAS